MKIPTYNTERISKLSTETVAQPMRIDREGQTGDALTQIGGAVEKGAAMLEEAARVRENLKASNVFETQAADIQNRRARDPDLSKEVQDSYEAQMAKAAQDASELNSLPVERTNFMLQHSSKVEINNIQMRNDVRTKMVRDMKAQAHLSINNLGEQFATGTHEQRVASIVSLQENSKALQRAGLFGTDNERQVFENNAIDKWKLAALKYGIRTDPENALEQIKKGGEGGYAGFSKEVLAEAKIAAEKEIKRQQALVKKNQNTIYRQTAGSLWNDLLYKELNPDHVEMELLRGRLREKDAKSMLTALKSPLAVDAKTDFETYKETAKFLNNQGTDVDASRGKLLEEYSNGKLAFSDLKKLYELPIIPTDEGYKSLDILAGQQAVSDDMAAINRIRIASAMKILDKFITPLHVNFLHTKNMLDAIASGSLSPEASVAHAFETVKKQRIQDRPEILQFPEKTGRKMIDPGTGTVVTVYPDGKFQAEDEEPEADSEDYTSGF